MTTANDHQDVLARLVRDLQSKETLCRAKDYPGVSLEQLNRHVKTDSPLFHPVLGEQRAFFIDQGRFVPFRIVVFGRSVIGPAISRALGNWTIWSALGGRVTAAQGELMIDNNTMLRMPDVVYTPRDDTRQLTDAQRWTRGGEPFAPTFVVEIDTLVGRHSRLDALDEKMRREYFLHGVQLGWLIDPKNKVMNKWDTIVRRLGDGAWTDLDGGTVLPGFRIRSRVLDMVLSPVPGSSSEEQVDFVCPERGCGHRFRTRGTWTAHAEWHREERATAKFEASQ